MAITVNDLHDLIKLLEEQPEWRAEIRRVLLTSDLLQLPELVREIADLQRQHGREIADIRSNIAQIVEIQRRHSQILEQNSRHIEKVEQQIAELTEIQRRHSQILEQNSRHIEKVEQQIAELTEIQRRHSQILEENSRQIAELVRGDELLRESLRQLVDWQRGEAGRRQGEQYEQFILRRATYLFAGGEGGSPAEREVRNALGTWLKPLYRDGYDIDAGSDPFLADVIWQKGDRVLVVEVSLKVDSEDVNRARQRADTLRRVGVDATPVVIGEEWAVITAQAEAQQKAVEWIVGGGFSQGVIEFRRLDWV